MILGLFCVRRETVLSSDTNDYRRLIEIGIAISAEKNIDSLLERILVEAKTMSGADAGTLYLVNKRHQLQFAIVLNDTLGIAQGVIYDEPVSLPEIPLVDENGKANMVNVAAKCANLKETIIIDDVYTAPGVDSSGVKRFDKLTGYTSRSFLTVPLKNFADQTIGVLQLINVKDETGEFVSFSKEAIPLIEALASQASVAMENRHLMDEQANLRKQLENEVDERTEELKNALSKLSEAHIILKELTTIDAVTGIRNRQYFDEVFDQEWRRAMRESYPITLMVLDIDHFKNVNDTYGHLAGDESLRSVAGAVDGLFNRPSDVVARYGGEEFVVVLPYINADNAAAKAEQVRRHIEKMPITADGHNINVTLSIGWVSIVPRDGMTSRLLISCADRALYEAKSGGRNRVVAGEMAAVLGRA
jgi:diguanylate cyclase (GGDEF)-like protein